MKTFVTWQESGVDIVPHSDLEVDELLLLQTFSSPQRNSQHPATISAVEAICVKPLSYFELRFRIHQMDFMQIPQFQRSPERSLKCRQVPFTAWLSISRDVLSCLQHKRWSCEVSLIWQILAPLSLHQTRDLSGADYRRAGRLPDDKEVLTGLESVGTSCHQSMRTIGWSRNTNTTNKFFPHSCQEQW